MGTMVTVHGAGDGGWAWTPVAEHLRQAGHRVFRCTLTGYGERRHLGSPAVTLDTHVQDVVNLIQYEDLDAVWLVGHSYGGIVITAVAERIPEQLAHLVYVDALVPTNGERARDLAPQAVAALEEQLGRDAWLWPRNAALSERYGPVLAKPFSEPVTATSPHAARLPRTYVAYAERDRTNPAYAAVAASAARVAEWGWPTIALPYDHNGHQSHPAEVAKLLNQLMAGRDG
jgi:pimeloyl-ACP methyl ester carboxylesterase